MGSRLNNAILIRKRIGNHVSENEEGEEYEGSKFGGFSEYFQRKRLKLQNRDAQLRCNSIGKPQIFRDIIIHVNGYTQPSLNDLHDIIVSHGGGFMQYLDGKSVVTHIIAASLTPKKAIEFRNYRIVKPAWIVDSVMAGKVIPWDGYRVIHEGPGQRLLGFDGRKIYSLTNIQKRSYCDQTTTSRYTGQIQKVADNINEKDDSYFQISSTVSTNALGDLKTSGPENPSFREHISHCSDKPPEDDLSSESFEITSSLEDVLDNGKVFYPKTGKKGTTYGSPNCSVEPVLSSPTENPIKKQQHHKTCSPTSDCSSKKYLRCDSNAPSLEAKNSLMDKKDKTMTAEEHNALLLADPKVRRSTTANPDFIRQFYSESRLHHLSVWKAKLKSRFQRMAAEKTASQKLPVRSKQGTRRYIMHIDFDCFFCAVSLKNYPAFTEKPAAVAHGSGSGSEIASCNYPARAFGLKNGMWMKNALRLCPHLKVLPYNFPAYEEVSEIFYQVILDVGDVVQSVSTDEALIDITSLCHDTSESTSGDICNESVCQEKANSIAGDLRSRIEEKTGCKVSVGIGQNILLAKLALRKAKPAGQYQIKPEDVQNFIGELGVQELPGVANSIGGKLRAIGINLVKDVRQLTKNRLMAVLGQNTGEKIWEYAHGIDHTEVGELVVRKSVSAELNWGIRFTSQTEAEEFVRNLCKELECRLLEQMVRGRQLTVKIMRKSPSAPHEPTKHLGHGICDKFSKSVVLGVATNDAVIIGRETVSILRSYGFPPGELRGLGVQMTKLEAWDPKGATLPEGSQRRIDIGIPTGLKPITKSFDDLINELQTPEGQKISPINRQKDGIKLNIDSHDDFIALPKSKTGSRFLRGNDPIHDDSPAKMKASPIHPAAAISKANSNELGAIKPLNVTGTQFIIPSQIDFSVLAELPDDIVSKVMKQNKLKINSRRDTPVLKKTPPSPIGQNLEPILSQIDPEILAALPEDVRAEVLAGYKIPAGPGPAQVSFSLTTKKTRSLSKPTKKPPTAKKHGRGRPVGVKAKHDPQQSSLVAHPSTVMKRISDESTSDELDPDFLSALPEDMRLELLAELRRQRHKAKEGIFLTDIAVNKKRPVEAPLIQRKIVLPEREPQPTFTTKDLSSVSQLRETISAWFKELAGNGPDPDDVAALGRYLRRVVLDEKNLAKVMSVVRWLEWLIDKSDEKTASIKVWILALEHIKNTVQIAVQERGLGKLDI